MDTARGSSTSRTPIGERNLTTKSWCVQQPRDSCLCLRLPTYLRELRSATCCDSLRTQPRVRLALVALYKFTKNNTPFADTVSVLQQAPGTLTTRAPDEVQWACGAEVVFLRIFFYQWNTAASRATSGT